MLREIISRCKNVKYCAGNFTQDFGLDWKMIELHIHGMPTLHFNNVNSGYIIEKPIFCIDKNMKYVVI